MMLIPSSTPDFSTKAPDRMQVNWHSDRGYHWGAIVEDKSLLDEPCSLQWTSIQELLTQEKERGSIPVMGDRVIADLRQALRDHTLKESLSPDAVTLACFLDTRRFLENCHFLEKLAPVNASTSSLTVTGSGELEVGGPSWFYSFALSHLTEEALEKRLYEILTEIKRALKAIENLQHTPLHSHADSALYQLEGLRRCLSAVAPWYPHPSGLYYLARGQAPTAPTKRMEIAIRKVTTIANEVRDFISNKASDTQKKLHRHYHQADTNDKYPYHLLSVQREGENYLAYAHELPTRGDMPAQCRPLAVQEVALRRLLNETEVKQLEQFSCAESSIFWSSVDPWNQLSQHLDLYLAQLTLWLKRIQDPALKPGKQELIQHVLVPDQKLFEAVYLGAKGNQESPKGVKGASHLQPTIKGAGEVAARLEELYHLLNLFTQFNGLLDNTTRQALDFYAKRQQEPCEWRPLRQLKQVNGWINTYMQRALFLAEFLSKIPLVNHLKEHLQPQLLEEKTLWHNGFFGKGGSSKKPQGIIQAFGKSMLTQAEKIDQLFYLLTPFQGCLTPEDKALLTKLSREGSQATPEEWKRANALADASWKKIVKNTHDVGVYRVKMHVHKSLQLYLQEEYNQWRQLNLKTTDQPTASIRQLQEGLYFLNHRQGFLTETEKATLDQFASFNNAASRFTQKEQPRDVTEELAKLTSIAQDYEQRLEPLKTLWETPLLRSYLANAVSASWKADIPLLEQACFGTWGSPATPQGAIQAAEMHQVTTDLPKKLAELQHYHAIIERYLWKFER